MRFAFMGYEVNFVEIKAVQAGYELNVPATVIPHAEGRLQFASVDQKNIMSFGPFEIQTIRLRLLPFDSAQA